MYMKGFTQVKNHTSVNTVKKLFVIEVIVLHMKEFTRVKSHSSVNIVKKHLIEEVTTIFI